MKLIRPQKISDQVLSVLEERIAEGVYEEGDKIPPERVLAEEFGVSRPSVRTALNVLVARQVLEARQGDGYYVSVKPQQDFLKSWQELFGQAFQLGTGCLRFQLPYRRLYGGFGGRTPYGCGFEADWVLA